MGEGLIILAAIVLGTELPIAPIQILWINMATAVMLGLMLAFEPKEPGIMERPPRDPQAPILGGTLLKRLGLVSLLMLTGAFGLFRWMIVTAEASVAEAQTAAATVIVVVEMFYLFNCRSLSRSMFRIGLFSNRAVIWGALGMLALQILFVHLPPMNRLFHTAPIGWDAWLAIMTIGAAVYVLRNRRDRKTSGGLYLAGRIVQAGGVPPGGRGRFGLVRPQGVAGPGAAQRDGRILHPRADGKPSTLQIGETSGKLFLYKSGLKACS